MATNWDDAYRRATAMMQPGSQGVQPPAKPGNTANIPYAPGMMGAYQGPGVPRARDLYPLPRDPGFTSPQISPSGSTGYDMGSNPAYQAYQRQGAMPPAQASGLLDALRRLIMARASVAGTRGVGTRY
jgi:hypothetical protein